MFSVLIHCRSQKIPCIHRCSGALFFSLKYLGLFLLLFKIHRSKLYVGLCLSAPLQNTKTALPMFSVSVSLKTQYNPAMFLGSLFFSSRLRSIGNMFGSVSLRLSKIPSGIRDVRFFWPLQYHLQNTQMFCCSGLSKRNMVEHHVLCLITVFPRYISLASRQLAFYISNISRYSTFKSEEGWIMFLSFLGSSKNPEGLEMFGFSGLFKRFMAEVYVLCARISVLPAIYKPRLLPRSLFLCPRIFQISLDALLSKGEERWPMLLSLWPLQNHSTYITMSVSLWLFKIQGLGLYVPCVRRRSQNHNRM
jgi:hypothetical protein